MTDKTNIDSDNYFSNICDKLEQSSVTRTANGKIVFSTLKILEYWVRILQATPDCVNPAVAIRLMNEQHTLAYINDIVKIFKPLIRKRKKQKAKAGDQGDAGDSEIMESIHIDPYDCPICSSNFLRSVDRYLKEKSGFNEGACGNLLKVVSELDANDMAPVLYHQFQQVTRDHFVAYALETIRAGIDKRDSSFARVRKLKEIYRLSDDELEILLFLWLRESNDLEMGNSEISFMRAHRFRDSDENMQSLQNIARATGFTQDHITELFGKDSTLTRLNLLDERMNLPIDVGQYLSGFRNNASMKAFAPAEPATISFSQLQGKNPDANLVLTMLRNHNRKGPLNILFYGVPGTGKTELAKALAAELNVPLWEVKIDADDNEIGGRRTDSRTDNLLQYRLRAVTLADWHCEKNPGIILVDEADLVLNGCEKGAMNHLVENLHTPVIWISNNMNFVEDSTRRRFDFSMAFKPLAKDERLSVLNSVLKAQNFENVLSDEEKMKLVVEYPAMAAGYTLAIQHAKSLMDCGANTAADTYKTAARILKAHTHLLGISTGSLKDVESHAPNYSLEGLNIEGSTSEIMEVVKNYDIVWQHMEEDEQPKSLNILLYGPPGTGKTEFVRYIARTLGRNLVIKRASDLLGMFVGQTEAQIAAAFEEANRTKSILFFDEADSFLGNRANAVREFEITKVNELLTQMENFKGIFIAATNFAENLDPASSRRFALKLGFNYLKPEGVAHIWSMFFPDIKCPETVKSLPMLTPGDFNAVDGRLRYFPAASKTAERIEAELRKELRCKDPRACRTMGF